MTDYIIIAIICVLVLIGVGSAVKRFRGESSCCGGSTYKARRKKLDKVIGKKTFVVEGMSCQHCVNRVQEAVNAIEGASGVVHLKKGTVVVSMEHEIADDTIRNAIEKAGYLVSAVRD